MNTLKSKWINKKINNSLRKEAIKKINKII